MPRSCNSHCIANRSAIGANVCAKVARAGVDVELDVLEEQTGRRVGMLVGLDDVAAPGDQRADGGDDARLVRALEQEHGTHEVSIVLGAAQKSVRSGSRMPACRRSRSISTHATPLLSA